MALHSCLYQTFDLQPTAVGLAGMTQASVLHVIKNLLIVNWRFRELSQWEGFCYFSYLTVGKWVESFSPMAVCSAAGFSWGPFWGVRLWVEVEKTHDSVHGHMSCSCLWGDHMLSFLWEGFFSSVWWVISCVSLHQLYQKLLVLFEDVLLGSSWNTL